MQSQYSHQRHVQAQTPADEVQLTPEMVQQKYQQVMASRAEEARLREEQAARPRSENLVDNISDMVTGEDSGKSVMDLTIDTAGVVLDPLNDLFDKGRGLVGMEPAGRITDTLKDAVRNTEAGFKVEQGMRQGARDIAMTPALPSAVYGLTAAAIEASTDDEPFAKAMLNEEGQALWDKWKKDESEEAGDELINNISDYQRGGIAFMSDWFAKTTAATGVEEREYSDTPVEEEVIGILASSFIGAPAGFVRMFGTNLVNKFGDAAVDKAVKMANTKTARAITRVAEAVTPMTLPLTPGNVAVNAAAGAGINDIMRYASGMDTALGKSMDAVRDLPLSIAEPELPEDPQAVKLMGITGEDVANVAVGSALVAGSVIVAKSLKRPDKIRKIITADSGIPHKAPPSGVYDFNDANILETKLVDSEAPIVQLFDDMVKANPTPEAIERRAAALDSIRTQVRQGGDVRLDAAWGEGVKPVTAGERYTMSGSDLTRVIDDELTTAQRRVLTEGLLAKDIQWTMQNRKNNPSRWKPQQIQQRIDALDNNPHLAKYENMYRTHTREILKEQKAAGKLTDEQYRDMMQRPYVPNIRADEPVEAGVRLSNIFGSDRSWENQFVSPFAQMRKGDVMDFVDPVDALAIYEKAQTRDMLENTARIDVVRNFNGLMKGLSAEQKAKMFPNGSPIRKTSKKNPPRSDRTIDIYQAGNKEVWEVGDPNLYNALKFSPHSALHMLASGRRLFQIGTTGEGNPIFAPTSASIDAFFGSLLRGRHQVGGFLDRFSGAHALRQTNNSITRGIGEVMGAAVAPVDAIGNIAHGIALGSWEHGVIGMAAGIERGMKAAGLDQIVGADMVKGMSRAASSKMHKTMSQQMRNNGYAPGRYSEQLGDMSAGAFDRAYRAVFEMPVLKQYRGTLNVIRDSYRLSFFSQQRAKYIREGFTDDAASKRAAREAREIGSDPSRAGQSKFVTEVSSAIPYANIGIQSLGAVARATTDGRAVSMSMIATSHMGYMAAMLGIMAATGGLEWWFNEVPDRERARMLPLINPTKLMDPDYEFSPNDVTMIDIGPEIAVLRSGGMAAWQYLAGMSSPNQWSDDRVQRHLAEMGDAARSVVPIGWPPHVSAALALAGYGAPQNDRLLNNRGLFKEPLEGTGMTGNEREINAGGGIMRDYVADILTATMGTAGRGIVDGVEQFEGHMQQADDGFLAALDSVFDRKMYNVKDEVAPTLFGNLRSPSRSAPVVERAYELRRMIDPILDQISIDQTGVTSSLEERVSLRQGVHEMSAKVSDPQLRVMLQMVGELWTSDVLIDEAYDTMRDKSAEWRLIQANRAMSRQTQAALMDGLTQQIINASDTVVNSYERTEARMVKAYGDKLGFSSLDELFKAAEKDLKQQQR